MRLLGLDDIWDITSGVDNKDYQGILCLICNIKIPIYSSMSQHRKTHDIFYDEESRGFIQRVRVIR